MQFLASAAVGVPLGLAEGGASWDGAAAALPELLFLGVVSTGVAFTLQIAAQRVASASQASVIASGEALVGAAAATWLLGEAPGLHTVFGGALILAAIALAVRPGRDRSPVAAT
jgi:drug/metabolite transporter (DMT)-like permease